MRQLSSGTGAELRAASKRPVLFIEAEFRTALVRLWTGSGKVSWQGQEWSGPTGARSGSVLSMETITETAGVEATGLKFVLSGVSLDLLGYALDEISIGKRCRVWLGFVDAAGALVDDPVAAFKGWMDASRITEEGGAGQITLTVENELRRLRIPVLRLLTAEDQKTDFPGDTAFRFMDAIKNFKGIWGSRQVAATGGGGGGCPLAGAPVRLYGKAEWWTKTTEPAEEWMFLVTETGRWGCFTVRDLRYTKRGLVQASELEQGVDVMLTEEGDERLTHATHVRLPGAMCDHYEATEGHVYSAWGFIGHNKMSRDDEDQGRLGRIR